MQCHLCTSSSILLHYAHALYCSHRPFSRFTAQILIHRLPNRHSSLNNQRISYDESLSASYTQLVPFFISLSFWAWISIWFCFTSQIPFYSGIFPCYSSSKFTLFVTIELQLKKSQASNPRHSTKTPSVVARLGSS